MLWNLIERFVMFNSEQYRAKANEYFERKRTANGPNEVSELHNLERSFTDLADNAKWVADNHDRTLRASDRGDANEVTFKQGQSSSFVPRSPLH